MATDIQEKFENGFCYKHQQQTFILHQHSKGHIKPTKDLEEVILWQHPNDYNAAEVEAKWLLDNADLDKNGYLNETEILITYDLFVDSSVTEWGASLLKHDEL